MTYLKILLIAERRHLQLKNFVHGDMVLGRIRMLFVGKCILPVIFFQINIYEYVTSGLGLFFMNIHSLGRNKEY